MKVKMILPALTEAKSPFFRPIKYSLFPPLGLATLAGYLGEGDAVELGPGHQGEASVEPAARAGSDPDRFRPPSGRTARELPAAGSPGGRGRCLGEPRQVHGEDVSRAARVRAGIAPPLALTLSWATGLPTADPGA